MATENIVVNITANAESLKPTLDLLVKMGQVSAKDAEEFKRLTAETTKLATESKKAATEAATVSDNLPGGKKNPKPSVETQKTAQGMGSLRAQIIAAKQEAIALAQQFGQFSPQAIEAAKRAAILVDRMNDLNKTVQALDPEAKLTAFVRLGGGIAGAFTAAQGAMALFGEESEDVQQAILKVQGALALTQGLNSVLQLKDTFRDLRILLGVTSVAGQGTAASIKAIGAALLTNPFTIAIAAIGGLAAALLSINSEIEKTTETMREQDKAAQDHANSLKELQIEYDLATGAITEFEAELAKIDFKKQTDIQDQYNKAIEETQKNTSSTNSVLSTLAATFGLYSLSATLAAKSADNYNKELEKQTAAIQPVIDKIEQLAAKQKAIAEAREAERKASEAERERIRLLEQEAKLRDEIFQEQLKANELLVEGEAQLIKRKLENLAIEERRAIAATTSALEEEATLLKFQNRRAELERQLNQAIAKENEKLTKEELDRKLQLFEQYYTELEINARNSAKTQEELQRSLLELGIRKLQDQINATTGDTSKLRLELQKLKDQLAELDKQEPLSGLRKVLTDIFGQLTDNQFEALKAQLQDFANQAEGLLFGIIDNISAGFQASAQELEAFKDRQLEAIDEEAQALELANDRKLISDGQLLREQEALAKRREATEKELNRKIADEKRKAFIADRAAALIKVAISTAEGIAKTIANLGFPLATPFVAIAAALGAAQAAIIASQPIPKFAKGVIGLQGKGTGTSDSILAMLSKGESVIPADKTAKFRPTLEAIHQNRISPEVLNALAVSHKFDPVEARLDPGKLTRSSKKLIPQQADAIGRAVAKYLKEERYYNPYR